MLLLLCVFVNADLLRQAKDHLQQSRPELALNAMNQYVKENPKNAVGYRFRAKIKEFMQKYSDAINDYTESITIKKDLLVVEARGWAELRIGLFLDAKADAKTSKSMNLDMNVTKAEHLYQMGQAELDNNRAKQALLTTERLLKITTHWSEARKLRGRVHLAMGNFHSAYIELSNYMIISKENLYAALAHVQFFGLNNQKKASELIVECLMKNEDDKECRTLKSEMFREKNKLSKVSSNQDIELKLREMENLNAKRNSILFLKNTYNGIRLMLYKKGCDNSVLKMCKQALKLEKTDNLLSRVVDLMIDLEMYDKALQKIQKLENELNKEFKDLKQRVYNARKSASKVNYYKILGVSRQATKKQIQLAHRKLALKFHPDRYKGDLDKETVTKKMALINKAKEYLLDDKKRKMIDLGQDPDNPAPPDMNFDGFPFEFFGNTKFKGFRFHY